MNSFIIERIAVTIKPVDINVYLISDHYWRMFVSIQEFQFAVVAQTSAIISPNHGQNNTTKYKNGAQASLKAAYMVGIITSVFLIMITF